MNHLGYGEQIRRKRTETNRERDRLFNELNSFAVTVITVGSKAEGLTCYLESDIDRLNVLKRVICVEAGVNLHSIPDEMEVYRMDTRVYPGHCRLFLERPGPKSFKSIINALCHNGDGDVLLSSGLFLDEAAKLSISSSKELGVVVHERTGPSIPWTCGAEIHDRVSSLRCHCPIILQRWAARPRHWPPPTIVQKVVSFGAYLTPVGFKGSENKHSEWRICFNTGESELVNNLNDTQAKMFVILKMILKDVLKPCKKEITSYVMKNIVLWQAERNPQNKFNTRGLFHWLHDGLRELRTAIDTQQLSYYMIPERNLMAASGLQKEQQSKWVADITDMMAEGPMVILRLPKIRQAIVASPEPMLWFSKRRMEMELLWLEFIIRDLKCRDENFEVDESDAIRQEIMNRMEDIAIDFGNRMLGEGCDENDLIDLLSRILM